MPSSANTTNINPNRMPVSLRSGKDSFMEL